MRVPLIPWMSLRLSYTVIRAGCGVERTYGRAGPARLCVVTVRLMLA
jgi:hypothetical protein